MVYENVDSTLPNSSQVGRIIFNNGTKFVVITEEEYLKKNKTNLNLLNQAQRLLEQQMSEIKVLKSELNKYKSEYVKLELHTKGVEKMLSEFIDKSQDKKTPTTTETTKKYPHRYALRLDVETGLINALFIDPRESSEDHELNWKI